MSLLPLSIASSKGEWRRRRFECFGALLFFNFPARKLGLPYKLSEKPVFVTACSAWLLNPFMATFPLWGTAYYYQRIWVLHVLIGIMSEVAKSKEQSPL